MNERLYATPLNNFQHKDEGFTAAANSPKRRGLRVVIAFVNNQTHRNSVNNIDIATKVAMMRHFGANRRNAELGPKRGLGTSGSWNPNSCGSSIGVVRLTAAPSKPS